jgi:nucleotide-binding universal stress UspA family protein
MFERILIPVDLSETSVELVERALAVASENAELFLLHVVERIEDDEPELETFYRRLEERARAELERLAVQVAVRGRTARRETVVGRRVEEIIAAAERSGADLVVLGSIPVARGGGLRDGLTVGFRVALLAPCAVLLVRTPRTPAPR